jgi:hypothetical protein
MKWLCSLLLCLLLFSLPAASLEIDSASTVSEQVRLSVRRALERAVLPLLKEDETLVAHIDTAVLTLSVGERHLALDMPGHEQDLETFLVSNLAYDGLVLVGELPPFGLEFVLDRGFAVENSSKTLIGEGRPYWVLDAKAENAEWWSLLMCEPASPSWPSSSRRQGESSLPAWPLPQWGCFPSV